MNIVVIDAEALPQGVDFPLLDLDKYGWQQYLALEGDDLVERCWRSDIVISLKTDINAEALNGWHKLSLLIVPADGSVSVDESGLRDEITVARIPGDLTSTANAEAWCAAAVDSIHTFLNQVKG
jgi:hypothetical protein